MVGREKVSVRLLKKEELESLWPFIEAKARRLTVA
jgi:hypothetical protein